jgi:hypothetical protein
MITKTCKAIEMLKNSEVIDIDGYVLSNWYIDTSDREDDESAFECFYSDVEGLFYEFFFSKKALMNAHIFKNKIFMADKYGDERVIACYTLKEVD